MKLNVRLIMILLVYGDAVDINKNKHIIIFGDIRSVDHSLFFISTTLVLITFIIGLEFLIVYFLVLIRFQSKCKKRINPFLY
jgi:hypothetical protein